MRIRRGEGVPAELEEVRGRFDEWRRTRTRRTRVPEPLWAAAVSMARKYGVHPTARTLRVSYERLKKRLEASAGSPADVSCSGERATFVELAGPVVPVSGECLLELEDSSGAKLRVHFKGVEPPDLVALSRSFWGMRS